MKLKDFHDICKRALEMNGNINNATNLTEIYLHNERRLSTRNTAAAFVRWHALNFNGSWDMVELENIRIAFKRVDLID